MSARTVHPIEIESYAILRSRLDTTDLPPLSRAVVERVVHTSADPTGRATWSATRTRCGPAGPRCWPARRWSPTCGWSRSASPPGPRRSALDLAAPLRRRRADPLGRRHPRGRPASTPTARCGRSATRPTALAELLRCAAAGWSTRRWWSGCRSGSSARSPRRPRCGPPGLPAVSNRSERGGAAAAAAAVNALLYSVDPHRGARMNRPADAGRPRHRRRRRASRSSSRSPSGCARRLAAQDVDVDGGFIELSQPTVHEAWTRARRAGAPPRWRPCRWCWSAPGTRRATSPPRWSARSAARPGHELRRSAARSARTPSCSRSLDERIDARRSETSPATAPRCCSSAAAPPTRTRTPRSARSRGCCRRAGSTTSWSPRSSRSPGPTWPPAWRAAGRWARARIVVAPVLPVRRGAAAPRRRPGPRVRGRAPGVDVRVAGYLGDCDELADLVVERYREALQGDIRMNCDTCAYRVAAARLRGQARRPADPAPPPRRPGARPRPRSRGHGHAAAQDDARGALSRRPRSRRPPRGRGRRRQRWPSAGSPGCSRPGPTSRSWRPRSRPRSRAWPTAQRAALDGPALPRRRPRRCLVRVACTDDPEVNAARRRGGGAAPRLLRACRRRPGRERGHARGRAARRPDRRGARRPRAPAARRPCAPRWWRRCRPGWSTTPPSRRRPVSRSSAAAPATRS